MSLEIRPGSEADFPHVAALQGLAPEAAQWPLGDYSGFSLLIALLDRTPAGFLWWRQTMPDEAELLNLAVHPGLRRRGVASALLDELARLAKGVIFLEVAEPNAPAIALYASKGWVRAAIRPGYYNHGTVAAVVMKKGSW